MIINAKEYLNNVCNDTINISREELRIAEEQSKDIKIEPESLMIKPEHLKEIREARAIKLEKESNNIICGKINIKQFLITAMKNDPELVDLDKLIDIVKEAYSEVLEGRYNEFYEEERLITLDEGKID